MRKRKLIFITAIALLVIVCGFFLLRINAVYRSHPPVMYESHTAVVKATIANWLQDNANQLPKQSVDLAMLSSDNDSVQDVVLIGVADWQVDNVVVQNRDPAALAVFDDDPIYGLKADLLITYKDGTQANLTWESWRYGIVLGSSVLSLGNGPPGYITAVAIQ
jgi:hypothetical protein